MSPSSSAREPAWWRFGVALATALLILLALAGFDPDGLPFQPGALFSDAATSHWPSALFLRRAVLDDGAFPLWRPLLMGGQPFAANPLNKVWYPPQWLALALAPAWHLNVLAALHLALAGAGAWVWGRATGLRAGSAALFGLAYPLAPRLVAALGAGHLDLIYAAAWFPWMMWAVWRVTRRGAGARDAIALGVIAALCFLADVRLSVYGFVTAAAYAAWLVIASGVWREQREGTRLALRLLGSALLAAGISALQWAPLLILRADLSRADLSLSDAAFGAIEPAGWAALALGDHGGGPETMVYVGVSVLALAAQPRRFGLWGVVVLVAALYAMGEASPLWLALLTAIVVADLLWIDRSLVEWRGADQWLEPHRALAEFLRDDGAVRVYSPSYGLPQQASAYWDIAQFGGVDPFQRAAFVAAAAEATGVRAESYSVTVPPLDVEGDAQIREANRDAVPDAEQLGAWLVTHVVADYPLEVEGLTLAGRVGAQYVYRNEAAPAAALDWDGPNRVTVTLLDDATGSLYAVAASGLGGMGKAGDLGLPNAVGEDEREWTFAAEPDEITLGVAAGIVCVTLAAAALWGAGRVAR